jgi:uncharacterized protein YjbJ (UPF0337 family)
LTKKTINQKITLMSQGTAIIKKETPSLKLPKAILSNDLGNRQQATGNRQQATGNRQQATGNRQQATGNRQLYTSNKNRVNHLIAYISHNNISPHFHLQGIDMSKWRYK